MIIPIDPDYIYEAVERALMKDLKRSHITSRSAIRRLAVRRTNRKIKSPPCGVTVAR